MYLYHHLHRQQLFLANLRGIETLLQTSLRHPSSQFLANLRGIETFI